MDTGRATSHQEAVELLKRFRLVIQAGENVAISRDHQLALLTLVQWPAEPVLVEFMSKAILITLSSSISLEQRL